MKLWEFLLDCSSTLFPRSGFSHSHGNPHLISSNSSKLPFKRAYRCLYLECLLHVKRSGLYLSGCTYLFRFLHGVLPCDISESNWFLACSDLYYWKNKVDHLQSLHVRVETWRKFTFMFVLLNLLFEVTFLMLNQIF